MSNLHDRLFYFDRTSEDDGTFREHPVWKDLFTAWLTGPEFRDGGDVIEFHDDGKVYIIHMPDGEVISEQEEKGLTAFQVEQAKRRAANGRRDIDPFLEDARKRQQQRHIVTYESADADDLIPEITG